MYHTNGEREGEVEKESKEFWSETPHETTETQGEKDSESLDSEELYADIPRTDDTTDGGKPTLEEFDYSSLVIQEGKRNGKFRKSSVLLILLLFIGLGVLTYKVLALKAQLKDSRTLLIRNREELKRYHEISERTQNDFEKELSEKENFMNQQLVKKNEELKRFRETSERIQNAFKKKLNRKDNFIKQQRLEKNEALNELRNQKEVMSHLKRSAISSVARTGNVEALKAITDTLGDNIELDGLEIIRILEVAATNRHVEVMSYIFRIFPKYILIDFQFPPGDDDESMYSRLNHLLTEILCTSKTNLIAEFFQMYGPFIVNYERYLYRFDGICEWTSMFDEALMKLILDDHFGFMGSIQDIQKENISHQYTDGYEKDSIKSHIRKRAQTGLENLMMRVHVDEWMIQLYKKKAH